MPIVNADVAAVFEEIADLLEVQGGNPFRIRAYRNAAHTVGQLVRSVGTMTPGELDALPGIGSDLAAKVGEIAATGSCAQLEELRRAVPPALTQLLALPGIGPKKVQALHAALGVETLEQLRAVAEQGRIRGVRGFSARGEQHILDAVRARLSQARRFPLALGRQVAAALLAQLRTAPGVRAAVAAGSVRRQRETVGDLDLLVTATRSQPVMDRFVAAPGVRTVLSKGPTRASVVLADGLQVDLRAVPPASFGAAWLYFTGSKPHNIALRRIAQERGLKLNEYGLYRGATRVAGATESSVCEALGLPWIPPELREDRGELEAARAMRLPRLVERADLRGDLHVHTTDSDGRESLQAMAAAARARGLEYIAVTDHSKRLALVHGLDAARLARQVDRIDALNERLQGITLAHPGGRLLGERPACDIDLQRVVRHARERGCFLELNTQPARLDLDDVACRLAKDEGVLVSVASDAHAALEYHHLASGLGQARRGWLEAKDVLNARSLQELRPLLAATMGRGGRVADRAWA